MTTQDARQYMNHTLPTLLGFDNDYFQGGYTVTEELVLITNNDYSFFRNKNNYYYIEPLINNYPVVVIPSKKFAINAGTIFQGDTDANLYLSANMESVNKGEEVKLNGVVLNVLVFHANKELDPLPQGQGEIKIPF